jgi:PAS domain S-box-containing protein
MVRWRKSFWVHEAPTDIGDGWSLAIAGSLSGVIDSLQKDTVDKLFLAFVVLALTLLLAPFAVRAVHRPLGQLTLAVRQLTETTTRTDVLWPKGAITEIETLVSGFRAMLDSVNENTAKLRGAEETASKAGAELRALVDTVNGPIFGIDTHGMVNEWNRAAERITGFTKAEVLGRNFVEKFVATEFRGPLKDVLDNALRGRETTNYEIPLYAKSGNSVDILLNLATRRNVAGKIIGAVGVGHPRRGSWHGPLSFETAR